MEIKPMGETATAEEQEAVASVLGPEATDGGRAAKAGLSRARDLRHLLLPALQAVQARVGWVSPGSLDVICRRLQVPTAEAYGVATFYHLLSTEPRPGRMVHVCDDVACLARGAGDLCHDLEREWGPEGSGESATWARSPCLGRCEAAPAGLLQEAGHGVGPSLEHLTAGAVAALLAGEDPHPSIRASHRPLVEAHVPRTSALDRALALGPQGVVRAVDASGLVGRGGAAFPTGRKWAAVAEAPGPRIVVANADESEPGTFKDRRIIEDDPFALIEAMTVAAFAVGAERGFVYVRGEYPEAIDRLEEAVGVCRTTGCLGADVLGSGLSFDVEIRAGAGAYVCGEETALFESIEGRRGEPRSKPPFPTERGLFGRPTLVNNVETLMAAAAIVEGVEGASRKAFCVSGSVRHPAVVEAPLGATLGELIERAGGLEPGRRIQAILLGGSSGAFVDPGHLDLELSHEATREAGATLGTGAVVVFDDGVDMRAVLRRIARFFRQESCGQCVPCRVGTVRQEEALERLLDGGDPGSERGILTDLEQAMRDASICGLGQTAGSALASAGRLGLLPGGAS